MAELRGDSPSDNRRKGGNAGKRVVEVATGSAAPCGACKFLRRKCISGCIFAPHFGTDQGAARFAAVHKVFGASNVSKLLLNIPMNRRHDAVVTISYEAQARLSDPVYGCVSTILALQQQVAALKAELALVQTQLINSQVAVANAFQSAQQQQQQQHHHQNISIMQPAYSNNSSASNNFINLRSFNSGLDLVGEATVPNTQSFEPIQLPQPSHDELEEDGDESHDPSLAVANQMIHSA
ncbi:LOB domain-containing protein 20 [Apium graveolens]|uniref:LOB domain-containing protein 20 n=1 Tax=Apium graveolens TaxID=4045 RepID=UPI003D79F6C5